MLRQAANVKRLNEDYLRRGIYAGLQGFRDQETRSGSDFGVTCGAAELFSLSTTDCCPQSSNGPLYEDSIATRLVLCSPSDALQVKDKALQVKDKALQVKDKALQVEDNALQVKDSKAKQSKAKRFHSTKASHQNSHNPTV